MALTPKKCAIVQQILTSVPALPIPSAPYSSMGLRSRGRPVAFLPARAALVDSPRAALVDSPATRRDTSRASAGRMPALGTTPVPADWEDPNSQDWEPPPDGKSKHGLRGHASLEDVDHHH